MSSFIRTAARAVDHTGSSLVDLGAEALRLTNLLRAIETRGVDSLLARFGHRRREGALGPMVWFAAGAVTAGAIVFLLAPESGKKLRARILRLWEKSRSEKETEPPARVPTTAPTANGAREVSAGQSSR
jgi:hypothetical protein